MEEEGNSMVHPLSYEYSSKGNFRLAPSLSNDIVPVQYYYLVRVPGTHSYILIRYSLYVRYSYRYLVQYCTKQYQYQSIKIKLFQNSQKRHSELISESNYLIIKISWKLTQVQLDERIIFETAFYIASK